MNSTILTASVHTRKSALQRFGYSTAVAFAALAPAMVAAQAAQPGPWKYSVSIYGYVPSIDASSRFPAEGGSSVNVSAKQILDRLKMVFMGNFQAHNGQWGVLTDVIYIDLGYTRANSRDFTLGDNGLPAGTTASLGWDYKATLWTLAGQYRVLSDSSMTLDVLAGARLLDQRQRLSWAISGDLDPLSPLARTGSAGLSQSVWDGIVGVNGRYVFGANRQWSVPLYMDIGTGQSRSTVQAAAGISYAFQQVELTALWRYVGYESKPGKAITDMSFNGPQLGAVFRW
jgi:hypothetical protein